MAATQVGVVRCWLTSTPATKFMFMTIKPSDDSELNNPVWLAGAPFNLTQGPWTFDMVKISLAQYNGYANFAAFRAAILAM